MARFIAHRSNYKGPQKFVNKSVNELDKIMQEMLPILQHNTSVLENNKENYYIDFVKKANDFLLNSKIKCTT